MRRRLIRLQPERAAVRAFGLGHMALAGRRRREVQVGFNEVGPNVERAVQRVHRTVQVATLTKCITEVAISFGEVRLKLKCAVICGNRFLELSDFLKSTAQIIVGGSVIGSYRRCLAKPHEGQIRSANLIGNYPDQVHRLRVCRLHRQNLPIDRLRLCQSPRLVMAESECQRLWDCHTLVWRH